MSAASARASELPNDPEELKSIIAQHEHVIAEHVLTIAEQARRIEALTRIAFGKQSEKRPRGPLPPEVFGQANLFHADLVAEAERTARAKSVQGEIVLSPPSKVRKGGGRRKRFPDHCPRVETRYELEDDARSCERCGGALHEIGDEKTRELERLEVTVLHEIRRAKYACRACTDGVRTAPGPDRVIDKGILGPGFLAHVAVERFSNHMPYHRLEKKYASEGLDLSRSVLERSMRRCAEILSPVAAQLRKEILAEPVLFTDDTPVTIARPQRRSGSIQGRVWIYLDRKGRHSYDFTDSRKRDGPLAVLGGYRGAVHADAYPGYDALFLPEGATEVACWVHARRKFLEAEKTEPKLAAEAMERIGALYAVEREAKKRGLDDDERRALRQQHSAVLVDELFAWMAKTEASVLPKGPMGRALAYTLTLEDALRRFLDDGRLEMDNNAAERALRAVAVGRKNWLFFQTEGGGETAVVLLSLVMTAKAAGVDPRTYLRDLLLRVARETDVAKLTPHGWKEHFQAEVEQERRAAMGALLGT